MTYEIKHTPFDIDGAYEHWTLVDATGATLGTYQSRARAAQAMTAAIAGRALPTPVWPEPGHGLRTCPTCGVPMSGDRCKECV